MDAFLSTATAFPPQEPLFIRVRHLSTFLIFPRGPPILVRFFSRWLTWYSLFSQKYSFWSATMWLKSWKLPALGGEKIKIWKSLQIGVRNLLNDERIPNLVSELKLDNIWPPFGRKLAKYTILPFIWYAEFYHSLLWKYIYSHPVHLLQYDSKCNTQMRNKYFFYRQVYIVVPFLKPLLCLKVDIVHL